MLTADESVISFALNGKAVQSLIDHRRPRYNVLLCLTLSLIVDFYSFFNVRF